MILRALPKQCQKRGISQQKRLVFHKLDQDVGPIWWFIDTLCDYIGQNSHTMFEVYEFFIVLYKHPVRHRTSGHSEGLHSGLLAEDLVPLIRPGESPRTVSRKCTEWIQCRSAFHHVELRRCLNRARWLLVDFVREYRNASALNSYAITERGSFSECFSFFIFIFTNVSLP